VMYSRGPRLEVLTGRSKTMMGKRNESHNTSKGPREESRPARSSATCRKRVAVDGPLPCSAAGRRAEVRANARPGLNSALEQTGRAGEPRRSGIAAAVVLQEHPVAGSRVGGPGNIGPAIGFGPADRSTTWVAACKRIARRREGARHPDRRCPVPAHQYSDRSPAPASPARDLGSGVRAGGPETVSAHDFIHKKKGRAIPYGSTTWQ